MEASTSARRPSSRKVTSSFGANPKARRDSQKDGAVGVSEPAVGSSSPDDEMKGYAGFARHELGLLKHDLSVIKRDFAEVRETIYDMQQREEQRAKWQVATTQSLKDTQDDLEKSRQELKDEVANLSRECAALRNLGGKDLKAGLDKLSANFQEQMRSLDTSLSHQKADIAKGHEVMEEKVEAKHAMVRKLLADYMTQEHVREMHSMKAFDDSFKALEARVESEMRRISNEHHDLRKMHLKYFQDSLDSSNASLREDINKLSVEFGPKLESYQTTVRSSLEHFQEMLQTELKTVSDERSNMKGEFQSSVQETVHNLMGTVSDIDARFAKEVERMSDLRRQDNLDLQRHMHNCVKLILPSTSSEQGDGMYPPREDIAYPSLWAT